MCHLVEVYGLFDIVFELFDESDVDIGLEQRGADLLEHGIENLLVDDGGLAQAVEGAGDLAPKVRQHHGGSSRLLSASIISIETKGTGIMMNLMWILDYIMAMDQTSNMS